jgi:hypothetical protein
VPVLVEILPLALSGGAIHALRPSGAASWQVACPSESDPGAAVTTALRSRGLRPSVVHSTSWRHDRGRLVLTYVAVLSGEPPSTAGLVARPVRPGELARGGALTPPVGLDVDQVLHHALRHLAWLQREDAAIAAELDPAWAAALAGHRPEPFSALSSGRRAVGRPLLATAG